MDQLNNSSVMADPFAFAQDDNQNGALYPDCRSVDATVLIVHAWTDMDGPPSAHNRKGERHRAPLFVVIALTV
jgi:hypothetical protein